MRSSSRILKVLMPRYLNGARVSTIFLVNLHLGASSVPLINIKIGAESIRALMSRKARFFSSSNKLLINS